MKVVGLKTSSAGTISIELLAVGWLTDVVGSQRVIGGVAGLTVGGRSIGIAVAQTIVREAYVVVVQI